MYALRLRAAWNAQRNGFSGPGCESRSLPPLRLRLRLPWKLTSDESSEDDAPLTGVARGANAQKKGTGKQTGNGKQAVTWMFSAYRQRAEELWTTRSAKVVLSC
jgi:hypothetical protein